MHSSSAPFPRRTSSCSKHQVLISTTLLFFLLEKLRGTFAYEEEIKAARHHITDDIGAYFQERRLNDDFHPSKILGPISDIEIGLGPIVSLGESSNFPKPNTPHWLSSGGFAEKRYVINHEESFVIGVAGRNLAML